MIKTIQAVVEETPDQLPVLNDTFSKLAVGQAFVADTCFELEDTNTFRVHHKTYFKLRSEFGLPAQLAVVANKFACASCKTVAKSKGRKPVFRGTSIHYDKRSATVNLEKATASLLTINGRVKVKLSIPTYFKRFVDWRAKESNLVKCKDGKLRLMVSIEKPTIKSSKKGKAIGVDRGITNLIATSDGWIYDSQHVWEVKQRYVRLRGRLRSKGTRSAKRHLCKIRGRENRFMRNVNHCVSRKLIESAGKNGVIVLEKLNGIRDAKHRRAQNWLFSNWAFSQLEQFLVYKGEEQGVAVELVPAKDTSKTCSACGSLKRGQRQGAVFKCKTCGIVMHSDFNASKNILHRYTTLAGWRQPAYCSPQGLSKPPLSSGGS